MSGRGAVCCGYCVLTAALFVLQTLYLLGTSIQPDGQPEQPEQYSRLFPRPGDVDDRIFAQLQYRPRTLKRTQRILLLDDRQRPFPVPYAEGSRQFQLDQCLVRDCVISRDAAGLADADALLLHDAVPEHLLHRPANSSGQVWLHVTLEAPVHATQHAHRLNALFNWTANYRPDADIVVPYGYWVRRATGQQGIDTPAEEQPNANASSAVWVASNCFTLNKREQLVRQLKQYMTVNTYGECGKQRCSTKAGHCHPQIAGNNLFYLAFENCHCRHYITEKLHDRALTQGLIPVVYGAHPDDYRRWAPPDSYIDVQQFGGNVSALADYLQRVATDPALRHKHTRWRQQYTRVPTKFWCRLCALLHAPAQPKTYDDFSAYWHPTASCVRDSWLS